MRTVMASSTLCWQAVIYDSGGLNGLEGRLADVNRDGKLDLVALNGCTNPCVDGSVGVFLNVLQVPTHTTVASGLNPSHVNQAVTLTATVSGLYSGKTTGSVTFRQGAIVLGTVAIAGGKATLKHAFATVGTFSITAVYTGDNNSKSSTSMPLKQVVTP
jgi:hypothetical protein